MINIQLTYQLTAKMCIGQVGLDTCEVRLGIDLKNNIAYNLVKTKYSFLVFLICFQRAGCIVSKNQIQKFSIMFNINV